jgi:excisionase family DNA binding protein
MTVEGKAYYRTNEACKRAGITRSTFLRWLKKGIIEDVHQADRRGWRLFSEEDISKIKAEACKVQYR